MLRDVYVRYCIDARNNEINRVERRHRLTNDRTVGNLTVVYSTRYRSGKVAAIREEPCVADAWLERQRY